KKKELKREEDIDLTGIPETTCLYYDDYKKSEFTARVLKIDGERVVLDQTLFYPRSGGQENDTGTLGGCRVYDVIKIGPHVIHKVEKPNFKVNEIVNGKIDMERRIQLTQHHTAAHIINYAARKVLGKHVNQAGAYKDVEKGRLDISHYESLSLDEIRKIEAEANKVVKMGIEVESKFMSRRAAEDKYGMGIYQGPAVPGKILRIISIKDIDTEACGGTHLKNTSEAGKIIITKTSKISDAVVRIEFKAGKAAEVEIQENIKIIKEIGEILGIKDFSAKNVINKVNLLFNAWKRIRKLSKKETLMEKDIEEIKSIKRNLIDKEIIPLNEEDVQIIISEISNILRTQKEHIVKTIKRFKDQIDENLRKIGPMV
ncbi:MAG: alanine--tRNA ligase-related protein, partial [Candidatus Micrarchaeia archaeon]